MTPMELEFATWNLSTDKMLSESTQRSSRNGLLGRERSQWAGKHWLRCCVILNFVSLLVRLRLLNWHQPHHSSFVSLLICIPFLFLTIIWFNWFICNAKLYHNFKISMIYDIHPCSTIIRLWCNCGMPYTPVYDAWLVVHVTLARVDLIVCECVGKAESHPESDNCAMTPNFQDSFQPWEGKALEVSEKKCI